MLVACGPAPKEGAALESSEESSQSSIIGGKLVAVKEVPAQTSVLLYDTAKKAICTGSLIGNNLVLTAAHCLGTDPSKMLVIFHTDSSKAKKEDARQVVGAIANPLWRTNRNLPKNSGDIALVKYLGATPAGYKAATILPNTSALKTGTAVLLAGYGISDGVKKSGSGVLRQVMTTISNAQFSASELQLEQRKGQGACHGDSGGPAYIVSNGTYYLWGVTSRGDQDPRDHCNGFSIYTNLLAHVKWLQEAAKSLMTRNQFSFTETERVFGRGQYY